MPAESAVRDGDGPGYALIETFRFEPGSGFVRLERHLARLEGSARELGFRYSRDRVDEALAGLSGRNAPLRVRLELALDGAVEVTSQPFVPLAPGTVWTIGIAEARLDAAGPLVRHKTTHRQIYEAARAEFSRDEADEVVLLNSDGRLCEGTITNVFVGSGDGLLRTPSLANGLLPGVLRAQLIEEGRAVEADLSPEDLRSAAAIFVGNSLRGLIPARLRA